MRIKFENLDWFKSENHMYVRAEMVETDKNIYLEFKRPVSPSAETYIMECNLYVNDASVAFWDFWGTRKECMDWIRSIVKTSENYFSCPFRLPIVGVV